MCNIIFYEYFINCNSISYSSSYICHYIQFVYHSEFISSVNCLLVSAIASSKNPVLGILLLDNESAIAQAIDSVVLNCEDIPLSKTHCLIPSKFGKCAETPLST